MAGQITHWVRIAVPSRTPAASITAVLAGDLETTEQTNEEKDVWLDSFTGRMAQPGPEKEAFFAGRRQLGLGINPDIAGNLVRSKAGERHERHHGRACRARWRQQAELARCD